jgi:membrane-bound serine protease (ClpP class)
MLRPLLLLFLALCLPGGAATEAVPPTVRVHVIPVRDQIGPAAHYVVRRGLKEAIAHRADAVVLDMKTPGGALDSTFEIMEALAKFPGHTLTYVNTEAISAGAFIAAATEEIWFAPEGIIGAAAPVSAGGQDVEATMKQKIVSYLKARIRAANEGRGYRGEVVSAMIDANYELKIGDQVIKARGELLSLTASEAAALYGAPPRPLLSAGTARSVEDLLARRFPGAKIEVVRLEVTWSEELAAWLNAISPLLMGLGLLCLYVEFKTPGFGVFGITGGALLAVVFFGSYVAGLSGHEPMLVFGAGLVLFAVEVFFFPGVIVPAVAGLALMVGALIWSMADLWPNQPLSVAWDAHLFVAPLVNLCLGVMIACALAVVLAKYLPRGWAWDRLALQATVEGTAQNAGGNVASSAALQALIGRRGVCVTALRPSGQIEIEGRRYEARATLGGIDRERTVVVRRVSDFGFEVEEVA